MYSVAAYGKMITDDLRMDAYVAALRKAIKPGCVVVDLGSGPGVFALLACKLGARRVHAVEPESVITVAREAATANGFADRIEFIEKLSTEITLRERADVIVSDLRGVLPWFQHHIPSIIDARERLLAPGGVLIPHQDVLWAAVVETPDRYEEILNPWQTNKFELDLSAGTRFVTNTWRKTYIKPEQLLVEPVCWTTIDYYEVDHCDIRAEISWSVARTGTAHGIAIWFDSDLLDGIGFSNHPAAPDLIYGNALFFLSEPVEVAEGERIKLRLTAKLIDNDYVWRWDTDFSKTSFKQSTFFGVPLSLERLKKEIM
jgi:protein arginine N-methyltransferase 1